jgi:hypothetical protein
VALDASGNLGGVGDITLVESEVALVVEHSGIVEGRAVIQLIE